MRMKALAGALLLALVVTGCSGAKDSQSPAPTPPPTSQPSPAAPAPSTPAPSTPAPTSPAPSTPPPSTGSPSAPTGSYPVRQSSKATYTVEESFVGRSGLSKAIGTTSTFEGALELKDGLVTGGTVKVDLRTLKSDSGQRDSTLMRQFLESNKYPFATYVISGMEGEALKEGALAAVTLNGKMTIHETERELTFVGLGGLSGGQVKLNLETNFNMTEFGITVPNIAGLLKAEDPVHLVIDVTAGQ